MIVSTQYSGLTFSTTSQAWKKNGGMQLMVVSVGRKRGVMTAMGWSFGGCLPINIKSKDLMTSMSRKKMGMAA